MYYPEQKPNCKYIIAPLNLLADEHSKDESLGMAAIRLQYGVNLLQSCIDRAHKMGLQAKLMRCRDKEATKVGSSRCTTWKVEISYPPDSPMYDTPPPDCEVLELARLLLPTHPRCHRIFWYIRIIFYFKMNDNTLKYVIRNIFTSCDKKTILKDVPVRMNFS